MPTPTDRNQVCRLLAFSLVLALASCESSTDPGPQPHSIGVTPNPLVLPQLGSQQLIPIVYDRDSALISGVTVSFSSSDESVVSVSKGGMVQSVGPAGSATVTLRAGAATETLPVTITAVHSSISVTPNPVAMPQKTSLTLDAKVLDAVGAPVPGATLTFTTTDAALFTVSATGVITSVGPAGVANLIVEHDTLQSLVPVAVTQVPTSIQVDRQRILLVVGGQAQLTATVVDAVGMPVAGAAVTYTSSNTSRVTVTSGGVVQSVGGTGTATITVTSGALTTDVDVEVVTEAHPLGTIVAQPAAGDTPWGVAVSSTGIVYVTTLNTGSVVRSLLGTPQFSTVQAGYSLPLSVAFSTSGATAYVSALDGIKVIDVASATTTATITGFTTHQLYSLALSPDGQTLAIGADGSFHLMDVASQTVTDHFPTPGIVNAIAFSPDGSRVYASQFTASVVGEFNVQTKAHVRDIAALGNPQGIGVSGDGNTLYIAKEHSSQGLEIVDLTTNDHIPVDLGTGCFGLAVAPDQTEVWLACGGKVSAVDLNTRTERTAVSAGWINRRIAFSSDGTTAVVTNEDGKVYFIK